MGQVVTTRSWGNRLGNAIIGIVFGLILIGGSFFLVFWNESNSLHTAQSLQQVEKYVVKVPISPIDEKNNLKVIYVTGPAVTTETLTDSLLGITENAIRLNRKVEMYQWKEEVDTKTEKELGGSEKEIKTYNYNRVWSDKPIDSSLFNDKVGHQNPPLPIQSTSQQATKVTLGDFTLPALLIDKIVETTPVDISQINPKNLQAKSKLPIQSEEHNLHLGDLSNPQIGDLRISMNKVAAQTVSIIAQQTGHSMQAYKAPAGKFIALLESGEQSPQQLINNAEFNNKSMTWALRLVSLIMMIIGIALILQPIVVLADVIPLFGTIVGFGTGIIAFVGGLILWLIATAIAWFFVRPIIGIGLIIFALLLSYFLLRKKSPATPKE